MFAGPNGSGKTTIKEALDPALIGIYVNADAIEAEIASTGALRLSPFQVSFETDRVLSFLIDSGWRDRAQIFTGFDSIQICEDEIQFGEVVPNSYLAAGCADLIRQELLLTKESFSFETVMSSRDKVLLLGRAQALGYRTYLYFVATADPEINISRVQNRVSAGGHSVPEEKIRARYDRSLGLLWEAIRFTNRAYIFDNSFLQGEHLLVAEITDGSDILIATGEVPQWFQTAVLDKVSG